MATEYSYIFFLGSHADLSVSEVWRVLVATGYSPTLVGSTDDWLWVKTRQVLTAGFIDRLGGCDRIGQVMVACDKEPSPSVLLDLLYSDQMPVTKVRLGLSEIGFRMDIDNYARAIKVEAEKRGGRLQFITPGRRASRLNSAQVEVHKLTCKPNFEATLLKYNSKCLVCTTLQVQDIAAYGLRDTERPKRDAKVGMLPPKLAQIMINLADSEKRSVGSDLSAGQKVLDPFCGMGTILQEAWLMDMQAVGLDASPRMVRAAKTNMDWLAKNFRVNPSLRPMIALNDIHTPPPRRLGQYDVLVSEPYLGAPVRKPLLDEVLTKRLTQLGRLYLAALKACRKVLLTDGAVSLILPAFRHGRGDQTFELLPDSFLDAVARLGYSKAHIVPDQLQDIWPDGSRGTIIYARPDALVGREISLWKVN